MLANRCIKQINAKLRLKPAPAGLPKLDGAVSGLLPTVNGIAAVNGAVLVILQSAVPALHGNDSAAQCTECSTRLVSSDDDAVIRASLNKFPGSAADALIEIIGANQPASYG